MAYKILYHNDLNVKSVEKTFAKTLQQLKDGDFKSADVKKMGDTGYYRARLDIRDRLLFSIIKVDGQNHLLLLEIIKDHNYARSRFLRGAILPSDDKLLPATPDEPGWGTQAQQMLYLNPQSQVVHLLNKFISFDAIQEQVLFLPAPLIIIGSAGSGKTALVLEKLKTLTGNVAYISLSAFLVENASTLYYANGYENEHQEAEFLSLNDYLASWEKPSGNEIHFRPFEAWFSRHAQALKINATYRVYEEFKGVITGSPTDKAYLSSDEYLALGIKQSIFSLEEREKLYPLFLKYLQWMKDNNWYDSNMVCYNYLEKIQPRYDYIMVDEVQDITGIQLKCILQSLSKKTNFILTGDSNQIVHPNFFSWAKIKTYFHQSGDTDRQIRILQTNYRNSRQVVDLSNNLLKIKNRRFGSIDRESNYLVNTISHESGEVLLYTNDDKKKNELNRRTQNSTRFAVIVADNIYKSSAAHFFKTPLIFSVQEAKGLEYENVILINFISHHDTEFLEITKGVTAADLEQQELQYNRASSKHDKDAEIYKFYINSFYVAITRAVKNIYLFEDKVTHPALQLLKMTESNREIRVSEVKSSREEWLKEAQRLEEQGKYEQAEQIRAKYLGYEYISPDQLVIIAGLALNPAKKEQEVKKERKQLFQYALAHQRFDWMEQLAALQFQRAVLHMKEVRVHRKEFEKNVRLGRGQEVLAIITKYGIGFTTDSGATALMLALQHGQHELITQLLKLNMPIRKTDNNYLTSVDYLLYGYYRTTLLKQQQMAGLQAVRQFWELVRPPGIFIVVQNRQLYIGSHSMLFFLIIAMRNMQHLQPRKVKITWPNPDKGNAQVGTFNMDDIEKLASLMPDDVLLPYRKNRTYINSIMASNEMDRAAYPGCKMIFRRLQRGVYILNPDITWQSN